MQQQIHDRLFVGQVFIAEKDSAQSCFGVKEKISTNTRIITIMTNGAIVIQIQKMPLFLVVKLKPFGKFPAMNCGVNIVLKAWPLKILLLPL